MEVPHVHKVMQQPNLLRALLSHHKKVEHGDHVQMGAPDLGERDPGKLAPMDDRNECFMWEPVKSGCERLINPFSRFMYSYTGDGRIVPHVKVSNNTYNNKLSLAMIGSKKAQE